MGPATDTLDLSIIIVTWNGKDFAMECLESLEQEKTRSTREVIVLDNASADGTPEMIANRFPWVRLIETGANLGFAKANNIGMRQSNGRYVCLVNSDVVLEPETFAPLVAYMDANPGVGILGPKMMEVQGTVGRSVTKIPTLWRAVCHALALHRFLNEVSLDSPHDVEVVNGWFVVVRKTALDMVGGLDDRFFMYGEDVDWCHRFLKAGWRIVFYPGVKALHYGGGSSKAAPTKYYVEMQRANLQYFRKHHNGFATFLYRVILVVHQTIRLTGYALRSVLTLFRDAQALYKIRRSLAGLRFLLAIPSGNQPRS